VGNSIVQLVQELFPAQWAAIPHEEQQEFMTDIQSCLIADEYPRVKKKHSRRQSIGFGDSSFRRARTVTQKKQQKREDKIKETKFNKPPKVAKSRNKWGGTLKTKGRKKSNIEVQLLSLSENLERDALAKTICDLTLSLLKQVYLFIEENRQISLPVTIPEEKDKKSYYQNKESMRTKNEKEKSKILVTRNDMLLDASRQITYELRKTSKYIPQPNKSEKPTLSNLLSRVRSRVLMDIDPKPLHIDESALTEGYNLLLMKNRILSSVQMSNCVI